MFQSDWKPNKRSSIPVYMQIKEYIRRKIEHGEWTVGSRIPTQRELAKAFGVNRSTVVTAIDELVAEGLLEGKGRKGTFVINNSWSLLSSRRPPNWHSYVQAGLYRPNQWTIQQINRLEFQREIIRLGTGELTPELFPKRRMERILQQLMRRMDSWGYEEPKGLLFLREQISQYLRSFGIVASPHSILIVSGALQALQLISLGLLKHGSTLLVERPSYLHSLHLFQSLQMKLRSLPMDEEGVIVKGLPELKRNDHATLLYTIPSFHNPTGILMSSERRRDLLEVCEKIQLPLVEDDVYRELWLDESAPPPIKANDKNGLVLYLGSMSKILSPGLRIGWVVGPEAVIERLADIKMQVDYGSSSLSQWVVAKWLESGEHIPYTEEVRSELRKRREIALEILEKEFSDLGIWNQPKGGFYIWLRLFSDISMKKLFEEALRQNILLNPGYLYDPFESNTLRISYGYASLTELITGLRRLAILIRKAC
ncbi:aminotransferase-like domain-containing protein [Thermoflavimicrobium dichotomicum]|uniref:GntR family transcriptional regulator, regulator for abcA and norABC n=1 Tax=Thermoflavimicrobium dichotomicum TaxID=46223 RepID=A0A1I3L4S6_9BACL|nr:PLP-dependent aminotransferase family protein [Thermoflavimicrobium dichotomicum]SFI79690.1 GntR family transcriptional regulator, regulator for abcA and norABC [Thermoflavimicrobium dichotomicum]